MREQLAAKAKRVAKDKVARKVSGGGSGGSGRSGGSGGKKKKGGMIIGCILLVIALGAGAFFAYQFGLLDGLFQPAEPGEPQQELFVHFIDVGQGDAILIHAPEGTMLIDAATRRMAPTIIEYIQDLGITYLTYIVATHPHYDHIGGFPAIMDVFPVHNVLIPDVMHDTQAFLRFMNAIDAQGLEYTVAVPGDAFSLGEAQFTVLGPAITGHGRLNDYSVVLRLQYGQRSFVFTGDVERRGEDAIVESGLNLRADVFQAPHHGSQSSSTEGFIDAVTPTYVVISVGSYNTYGHPHDVVMERFQARGLQILRTDESGSIVFETDGIDLTHRTER